MFGTSGTLRARSDSLDLSTFDDAAGRLLEAVASGDSSRIAPDDLKAVVDALLRVLRRFYPIGEAEAEDAAHEAVLRLLELASAPTQASPAIRNPGAYLMWLARNRAIDRLRRRDREEAESAERAPNRLTNDDEIAALLDADATARMTDAAMRGAVEAGDHLVVRVVSSWLDIAEESGHAPSSREVAARAGLSHTSVNQALKRFRLYFPRDATGTSSD